MTIYSETQAEIPFIVDDRGALDLPSSESFPESKTPFSGTRGRLTVTADNLGPNERYRGPHELVYLSPEDIQGKYPKVAEAKHLHNIAEGIVNLTDLTTQYEIDTLLFLDKSARPMAYLFRKTWDKVFPDEEKPDIRFIDVGQGSNEPAKRQDKNVLAEVQNRYAGSVVGKRVLIVDEYSETGHSLLSAKQLIEELFPEAEKVYATAVSPTLPKWYGNRGEIGIANAYEYVPPGYGATVEPSFISSTISGAIDRAEISEVWNDWSDRLTSLNLEKEETLLESAGLRKELTALANELASRFRKVPAGSFKVTPYVPNSVYDGNKELLIQ